METYYDVSSVAFWEAAPYLFKRRIAVVREKARLTVSAKYGEPGDPLLTWKVWGTS